MRVTGHTIAFLKKLVLIKKLKPDNYFNFEEKGHC